MLDIPIVEDLFQAKIFLYDLDLADRARIGKLARRSVGKDSNTVQLLRDNSQICYPISMLLLKHILAHRVIKLIVNQENLRGIWQSAVKALNICT